MFRVCFLWDFFFNKCENGSEIFRVIAMWTLFIIIQFSIASTQLTWFHIEQIDLDFFPFVIWKTESKEFT